MATTSSTWLKLKEVLDELHISRTTFNLWKTDGRTQFQRRVFGALHVSTPRAKTLQVQTERRIACCRRYFLGAIKMSSK